jgi:hypothetical protein
MEDHAQHGQDGDVVKAATAPIEVNDPPEYVVKGVCAFSVVRREDDTSRDPFASLSDFLCAEVMRRHRK